MIRTAFAPAICGLVVTLLLFSQGIAAQDLEQVANDIGTINRKSLKLSGGLNLGANYYNVSGISARQDELQYRLNANLNLSLLGINAPFSLHFSDGNQAFNLPSYTFAGISPSYKWARLHLGARNLNFSRYTLAGINFEGAGVELTPGKFYAAGMYGRLRRAQLSDLNSLQDLDPIYKRMGWGAKVGYGSGRDKVHLSLFSAWDDESSIPTPAQLSITPTENLVGSVAFSKSLGKRLTAEGEWAQSATNTDTQLSDLSEEMPNSWANSLGLLAPNASYATGDALRGGLNYTGRGYSLGAQYERIDRAFRTLGALFFNSDVENITARLSTNLFKNKINLSTNVGIERNNLDDEEKTATRRLVYSMNAGFYPDNNFSINASYSNFENTTKLRSLVDPLNNIDSVFLSQLTQTAGLSATYQLQEGRSLTFIGSYQTANSIVEDMVREEELTTFYNAMLLYNMQLAESGFSLNASFNFNQTELALGSTQTLSPSLGITKNFAEQKLRTDLRSTFNRIRQGDNQTNSVLTLLGGLSYSLVSGHTLSSRLYWIKRLNDTEMLPAFSEFRGGLTYGFQF